MITTIFNFLNYEHKDYNKLNSILFNKTYRLKFILILEKIIADKSESTYVYILD
jgi:hypothetical protein